MTARPFRFGVNEAPGADTVSKARRFEALGYDVLLAPDRPNLLSPLPILAAAGAVTERLGLGTYVLAANLHEPQALVRQLKAVRAVAADRFEPGFGAGLEPGSGADKRQRLNTLLEAVRSELPDARILVAASGRVGLELAAWLAQTVALSLPPQAGAAEIQQRIELLRGAADGIELNYSLTAVGDLPAPWLARQGLDPQALRAARAASLLWGDADAMCEQLEQRREALGISYWTVPAAFAEHLAPLVSMLRGR
ncbi:MAG: LLM class flavin-dependent oxidoreductase [Candidatus Dormibacteraeota bacterium]|nr:LLM class flavin-dependent oxidoreductase [Candidatus Dormibacteraeota bacterium]